MLYGIFTETPVELTIDAEGLDDTMGADWELTVDALPEASPDPDEAVHILCPYTKAVWDQIHRRDETTDRHDRKPTEATAYVTTATAYPVDVTLAIPQDDAELKAEIEGELSALFYADGAPETTINDWAIRQAVASAEGHTAHRMVDINGGGPTGSATTTAFEVHTLGTVTWEDWE